jgi:hypothetical protein
MSTTLLPPITTTLQLIDLAIYLPKLHTLVISDVHVGIEDALHREGLLLPRQHLTKIQQRLEKIFRSLKITAENPFQRLIVNGDFRHQFGPLSKQESKESLALLRWLTEYTKILTLIEGNHDGKLDWLAEPFSNSEVKKSHLEDLFFFIHGDEIPENIPNSAEWIIIGHEHPAISLRDPVTNRYEAFKCFLSGNFQDKKLLVQPSFNLLIQGTDLCKEEVLSPFLRKNSLGEFLVYLVDDTGKIFDFGPLKKLL